MRIDLAGLSGIPFSWVMIPTKRAGYFPYDSFSLPKLIKNLYIVHAYILEINTNKFKRTE